MAGLTQQGAWNSSSILAGYGLSSVIGPIQPTSADIKRYNSRSGGKHSGVGNWMQNYRPTPIIESGRPKRMYDYGHGELPAVQKRLPGLSSRKVGSYRGPRKPLEFKTLRAARDIDEGQLPSVVKNETAIQDWLGDINSYADMETESTNTRPRRASTVNTDYIRIPDRMVQNNNRGPNPANHFPSFVADDERMALDRLYDNMIEVIQARQSPPEYTEPTSAVRERLEAEAAERAAF